MPSISLESNQEMKLLLTEQRKTCSSALVAPKEIHCRGIEILRLEWGDLYHHTKYDGA